MKLLNKFLVPCLIFVWISGCLGGEGPSLYPRFGNPPVGQGGTPAGTGQATSPESPESGGVEPSGSVPESPGEGADGGDVLSGPAAALLIDGTVHTGTDWGGRPYVGVWGEPLSFRMDGYPVTWAMAVVHASLLLQSRDIHYSPNAVLSVAIKESRLECSRAFFPNEDGCFQIESMTAYNELKRIFPDRFINPHSAVISGAHFESSALSMVYYTLFSMGMFYMHSPDPYFFFAGHPAASAQQKVIGAAYNRGLWWVGLKNTFQNCGNQDVTHCFEEHAIVIDHANAIADYTRGLDNAAPFDAQVTLGDLQNYWAAIKSLYPDANESRVLSTLSSSFQGAAGGANSISFNKGLKGVLEDLISALPPLPTHQEVIQSICRIGYLWNRPPCP